MKPANKPPRPQDPNAKGGLPPRPVAGKAPAAAGSVPVAAGNAAVKKAQPAAVPVRPGPSPREQARAPQRPTGSAATAAATADAEEEEDEAPEGFIGTIKLWISEAGGAYLASMLFHTALFLLGFLVLGSTYIYQKINEGTTFDSVELLQLDDENIKPLKLDQPSDEMPSEIDLKNTLMKGDENSKLKEGAEVSQTAKYFDDSPTFEDTGGGLKSVATDAPQLGGASFDFSTLRAGPTMKGPGGLGAGGGEGDSAGIGGSGTGLGGRGKGSRQAMVARYGGTKGTERAVNAALNWLARHQNRDGSWSLSKFNAHCRYGACSGAGSAESDAAATAFGLLPYFGAGQTHNTEGQYKNNIRAGINWLMQKQKPNGDLSAGSTHQMYTHGLATIALCEAYALSKDSRVGQSAQAAINFIQAAQDKNGGGWRYHPGEAGDTSVVGWQVMALKSGQMAKLNVNPQVLAGAKKFLTMASGSEYGWKFGYTGPGPTPTMAGVGLLCRQYLGAAKDDPGLTEGSKYLMANMPNQGSRSIYYWYYATQVIHNMLGEDWDKWNKAMRKILVNTQDRQGCPAGSWDPAKPSADAWGQHGGRVMMTSLSCLTLEIYYRYLPLFDMDQKGAHKGAPDLKGVKDKGLEKLEKGE